jgi:hypothetical protein
MSAALLDLTRRSQQDKFGYRSDKLATFFCFNYGVSYLEPLYSTVGGGPSWSTTIFFFGKLLQHLGFSLCFLEVAMVAKNG